MIALSTSSHSTERVAACEDALELAHIALVDSAVSEGWTEREVARALLNRALDHLALLDGAGSRAWDEAFSPASEAVAAA